MLNNNPFFLNRDRDLSALARLPLADGSKSVWTGTGWEVRNKATVERVSPGSYATTEELDRQLRAELDRARAELASAEEKYYLTSAHGMDPGKAGRARLEDAGSRVRELEKRLSDLRAYAEQDLSMHGARDEDLRKRAEALATRRAGLLKQAREASTSSKTKAKARLRDALSMFREELGLFRAASPPLGLADVRVVTEPARHDEESLAREKSRKDLADSKSKLKRRLKQQS